VTGARRKAVNLPDTTVELGRLIDGLLHRPDKRERIHPATRVFQALRIVVNDELDALRDSVGVATSRLTRAGRIVAISFHSLEDRIVKQKFRDDLRLEMLTRTPVTPDDVIFSFAAFRRLSPQAAAYYRHIVKVEKTGDNEISFTFDGPGNRELPQILGQLKDAYIQAQRAFNLGNATLRVQIINGTRYSPTASITGTANRNIIVLPCMVKIWLYRSGPINRFSGRESCARMIAASIPPRMRKMIAVPM